MPATKLTENEIREQLGRVEGWSLNDKGEISRTFKLKGFQQALLFVNSLGLLAEAANHHPDILIQWNKVSLSLTTHDSGGLTEKDFHLAEKVNALPLI